MNHGLEAFCSRLTLAKRLYRRFSGQGAYPAGHYHSPVPKRAEVLAYLDRRKRPEKTLPGIDLNGEHQLGLLREYLPFYAELPFPEQQRQDCRYYYANRWFSYADAIFLYCFLRKHTPRRIIEIGSGFSSAVILDTVDRHFPRPPEITFVEPHAGRLRGLLREGDESRVRVIESNIQAAPPGWFSPLEPGDLLFIDSSHVVKCGSDLQLLLFDVLPLLPAGVFVHFHDVFYPFEYPSEWLRQGRFWNENDFLRAFLSYNAEWEIYFFNRYAAFAFGDFLEAEMPLCVRNPGGGLYLRRRAKG